MFISGTTGRGNRSRDMNGFFELHGWRLPNWQRVFTAENRLFIDCRECGGAGMSMVNLTGLAKPSRKPQLTSSSGLCATARITGLHQSSR